MVIVLFSLGMLFVGSLGAELSLARLSFVGCICGMIVYFAGAKVLRAMAVPHRVFAVRHSHADGVYNEIVFPLQFIASQVRYAHPGNSQPLPHHARRQCAYLARHERWRSWKPAAVFAR